MEWNNFDPNIPEIKIKLYHKKFNIWFYAWLEHLKIYLNLSLYDLNHYCLWSSDYL